MRPISPVSVVEPELDANFPFDCARLSPEEYEFIRRADSGEKHLVFFRRMSSQDNVANSDGNSEGGSGSKPLQRGDRSEEIEITLVPLLHRDNAVGTPGRTSDEPFTEAVGMVGGATKKSCASRKLAIGMKRVTCKMKGCQKTSAVPKMASQYSAEIDGNHELSSDNDTSTSESDSDSESRRHQPQPICKAPSTATDTSSLRSALSKESRLAGGMPIRTRSVSFHEALVTEVRHTPSVLPQERHVLFYSPTDIKLFKIDYRYRMENGFHQEEFEEMADGDENNFFCIQCPC